MLHLKISKSEKDAYDKDVRRLRAVLKPKGKVSDNISTAEMQALLRSTHKLRRQMLVEKKDAELSMKVLQHQEMFHEEAVSFFMGCLLFFFANLAFHS